jgi:hypothetical protein
MHARSRGLWLLVLTALLVVTGLVGSPPAGAVSPPVLDRAFFYASSCVTSSDCWAVGGEASASGSGLGLFVHWDGATWAAQRTVDMGQSFLMHGVDCVSTSDCWAVGWAGPGVFSAVEHWDGSSWSLLPGGAAGVILQSVSCVASDDCWAAGQDEGQPDPSPSYMIHWDGAVWTRFASPAMAAYTVKCVSSSWCIAAGNGANTVLVWNGVAWTADPTSIQTDQQPSSGYSGIDCTDPSNCWAFHHGIDHFDGTSWTTVLSSDTWDGELGIPITPYPLDLGAISCASAVNCTAVRLGTGGKTPASARWDGVTWTVDKLPQQGQANSIWNLDCSTGSCFAVGSSTAALSGPDQTLIVTDADLMPALAPVAGARFASAAAAPSWSIVPTPKLWSWVDLPGGPPAVTSASDSVPGQPVVVSATLPQPAVRRGTMTFYDNGVRFARTVIPLGGTVTKGIDRPRTAGDHAITATFTPLAPYLPVTGSGVQHVAQASTVVTLSTVVVGTRATIYTAVARRVAPAVGAVTTGGALAFYDGTTLVALVPTVPSGAARVVIYGVGRPLVAVYSGSFNDLPSA